MQKIPERLVLIGRWSMPRLEAEDTGIAVCLCPCDRIHIDIIHRGHQNLHPRNRHDPVTQIDLIRHLKVTHSLCDRMRVRNDMITLRDIQPVVMVKSRIKTSHLFPCRPVFKCQKGMVKNNNSLTGFTQMIHRLFYISLILKPDSYFFRWYGTWFRKQLKTVSHFFVQDQTTANQLKDNGMNNVTVCGDTRFDRVAAIARQVKPFPEIERFIQGRKCIIAGSTWPPDERLLARYMTETPGVKLVLAPHEIHEAHLHQIFQQFEGRFVRLTQATINNLDAVRVLVVDTMGMLSSIYRYGQVAYIGGGFGVGIHNTIEAAVFGMPVLFGPNYKHFREACALIEAGGAKSVSNYAEFKSAMDQALADHETIGKKASDYVESELGATDRIYQTLFG